MGPQEGRRMTEGEAREILEVGAAATPSQLKAAYRSRLKTWHPDLLAPDAASDSEAVRKTQLINAAYRLLGGDAQSLGPQEDWSEAAAPADWSPEPFQTGFGPSTTWSKLLVGTLLVVVITALSSLVLSLVQG